MVLTLFCVATLTFTLMHSIPGGPFSRERKLPDAILRSLNAKYNLDAPLSEQYIDYMTGLVRGDLGPSFQFANRNVSDMIGTGLPFTMRIGGIAILLTVLLGVPLGIIAALWQHKPADYTIMFFITLGVTIPSFVIATLLVYVFSIRLGWFPSISSQMETWKTMVMPVFALTCYYTSFICRLMRSSMLDIVSADYIRTARSKGISEFKVIMKHVFKNAIIPVVSYLPPMVAGLLAGSFVIEKMFTVPGIGRYFVESITNRDYTMIMGTTIFYAALLVTLGFIVDIAYGLIDPRIKLGNTRNE